MREGEGVEMVVETVRLSPAELEYRRERMIGQLADWQESVDPCEQGHVEHGPEAHLGRHLVHTTTPHGFGAPWDYDDAVAFIQGASWIGAAVEPPRRRAGHVEARGADGKLVYFELRAALGDSR